MRSWIKDIFITGLLLSAFIWAGLEFYRDLNSQISNEGGEVIGEITFINNSAQRKFADRAIWGELETSAPLYNYDSLRTIEGSEAVIKLIDGTEITLAANTYIVLEWGEEEQNIEFLGGNISAERSGEGGTTLNIKAEDTLIALDNASVTLNRKAGEAINLSVDKGAIDVTVGDKTQNIAENYRASIADDIRVEQEAVTLQYPANNRLFMTTSASVAINFQWEQILPLENLILELSEERDFRSSDRLIPDPGFSEYTKETLPGTYYWRIRGKYTDGTPYFSPANRMVLIRDRAPALQVPVMDEVFQYRKTFPDMAFSWESSGLTNSSRLQLAEDPEFTDILTDLSSNNNFYTIRKVPAGEYFWRVIPEYNTATKISYARPDIRRFKVELNETIAPPELILPEHREQINPLKSKEGLRFSWLADREISSYHLRVARDAGMSNLLVDQWLNRNSYLMNTLPEQGRYFWEVDGLDNENKAVPPSDTRNFTILAARIYIEPEQPATDSLLIVDSYDSTPFSWDSSLEGPYEIQIFREDNALVPLLTQRFLSSAAAIPLPGAGNYYWQASVLDDNDKQLIKSDQIPFRMADKLKMPNIQEPLENVSLSVVGENPLSISWLPVGEAEYFNAELIPSNRNFPTLKKMHFPGNSWNIEDKSQLRVGSYTLKVQAFHQIDPEHLNSSDPALRTFKLNKVQNYDRPSLIYPAAGQNLSRLTILDQKPSFRWTQTPPLPVQQIRLSRDPNFATSILDEQLAVMNREIPDLPEGNYYLQILSRDAEGNSAPPSSLYSFNVTPIPLLSTPYIREPTADSVIDMQIRDELNFKWAPVANTSYYDLKLYRKADGAMVFHRDKMKLPEYTFTKMEDLNVGSFVLEIQAFREKNGVIFQKSSVQTVPFELTLPEITEIPEILSPELQYAR
ncbi:MAG: hypothetical protein B6241_01660 [Spirochaetaceae bacterium 4572_59]|nr:MAG: hypothetical protein B6241_01660 [Spirochaetaceae bacterium 4572_59]